MNQQERAQLQLVLGVAAVVAGVGLVAYACQNHASIFATKADVQREGALLTKIAMALQRSSHTRKKIFQPLVDKDIDNVVFLEKGTHQKEHKKSVNVKWAIKGSRHNSAVKEVDLISPNARVTVKIYCR